LARLLSAPRMLLRLLIWGRIKTGHAPRFALGGLGGFCDALPHGGGIYTVKTVRQYWYHGHNPSPYSHVPRIAMSVLESPLPKPPEHLEHNSISLRFSKVMPGDATRGFVPYYHYRIFADDADVGHLNLRVGDTEHVRLSAGHVGFEIATPFRGHRHALSACRALAPFARSFPMPLILTCDPDNHASRRTIELLGATFVDEVAVPSHDPHFVRGSRTKLRFEWIP
jgi:hypothetical protein